MAGQIKVEVLPDKSAVAQRAASIIAERIRANPALVLGLATGSTPEGAYARLGEQCRTGKVSFASVTTFNLDEYWGLDGSHPQSYRHFMQEKLFRHIDIQPWNTHLLNGRARHAGYECEAYEKKIVACGGIDLWVLGIGNNGHIAFNEPGSPVDTRTRLVSLTQSTIDANSDGRFFDNPADVPRCALSAGIATIREAHELLLLATGKNKAHAIAAAINGPFTPDLPASLLQDHANCTFLLDKEAASELR